MPRNPQGLYTLPLPPVVPGELIEADWANPTLDDIASALTGSLPRNGTAPMLAPLTLSNIPPSQPRHAVDKAYLDNFLAYATGMPVGAVMPVAGSTVPPGFLLCDGQAVSRTTYPALFNEIGVIYGAGDGATTFNVPDMRDWFVRGRDPATRTIGSTQASSFATHSHPLNDPGHGHTQAAHSHTLTTQSHSHGITDPGHSHMAKDLPGGTGVFGGGAGFTLVDQPTSVALTGISIQAAGALSGTTDNKQPTVDQSATGVSIGVAGGTETRPQNIAMNYVIKAIDDATATVAITGVTSSDDNCISIDNSNPVVPELDIHTNIAFGLVKLDSGGTIPLNLLPTGQQALLGYWDASPGLLPTGTFNSGDSYIISVAGTLTVYDPVTLTAAATPVNVGDFIVYITGSPTNPTGWYHVVPATTVTAGQVQFTPVGTIGATNVQAAIAEVDGDVTALAGVVAAQAADIADRVLQSSPTGAALIPAGSTAERDTTDLGAFRYNSETNTFEGLSNTGWGAIGGGSGQMYGTAEVKAIFYNSQSIAENINVLAGQNGGSFGPVQVEDGFTVTVANGSVWSVV